MSVLSKNKDMMNDLDAFFANKTVMDADRSTFLICELKDKIFKLSICLVFMRDWDSIESNDYNYVSVYRRGAVFTLPCYWVSIPKQLAIPYIEAIIEEFYNKEVVTWGLGYAPDYNEDGTPNTGCCCSPNFTSGSNPPCGLQA